MGDSRTTRAMRRRPALVISCATFACLFQSVYANTKASNTCNAVDEMDLCKDLDVVVLTHKATFANLQAGDYTGKVKETYEVGYGIALGIYNTTAKAYKFGCSVTSSIKARRSVTVEFKGSAYTSLAAS